MADGASNPWPTTLRLHNAGRTLTVEFDNGETYDLAAEYLRVRSPSAEGRGHSPAERKTIAGKKNVAIIEGVPIGNYAVRLVFDRLAASAIYTRNKRIPLGPARDAKWPAYPHGL